MSNKESASTKSTPAIHWKNKPEEHDYPAAQDYLELIMPPRSAAAVVKLLKKENVSKKKAKDIFRASRLAMLPATNPHVKSDLEKVHKGILLSPLLLIRGSIGDNAPLVIADGYHRLCASYSVDENAEVTCKIVTFG